MYTPYSMPGMTEDKKQEFVVRCTGYINKKYAYA